MRLLHPRTIQILASHPEFPKTHLAHCWAECFKYLASGQKHPKMFINDNRTLGKYLRFVYEYGIKAGCNLDKEKIKSLPIAIQTGFNKEDYSYITSSYYFDNNYLFSDACSLYFKGINIFQDIFGDEWEKYCPVISLKEIKRQVDKTLSK